jgi:hypothetical protein
MKFPRYILGFAKEPPEIPPAKNLLIPQVVDFPLGKKQHNTMASLLSWMITMTALWQFHIATITIVGIGFIIGQLSLNIHFIFS